MASALVGTTPRSGLSVEQVGGNDVYKLLPQLVAVLKEGFGSKAGPFVKLFAEPQEIGRDIDWYADGENVSGPVTKLAPEEEEKVLNRLQNLWEALEVYAQKLEKDGGVSSKNYAEILRKARKVPGSNPGDYVYSVDGQPVVICWGFTAGNNDVVDGISDLIKQARKKKAAAEEPQPAPEPETKPEPVPEPAPGQVPVPPPAKSSKGIIWAAIIGGLLVLAGAFAAWYFLMHDNQTTETKQDFTYLKGSFNGAGMLQNAAGEDIDIKLTFPDTDGAGQVEILEPEQTCSGRAQASEAGGNLVALQIIPDKCPNGATYDPFTLTCDKTAYNCSGIYPGGGSWNLTLTR